MKVKITAIMLIMCFVATCFLSCNQYVKKTDTASADLTEQNEIAALSIRETTVEKEKASDNQPEACGIPLSFYDYDDFLLFGYEGKLDPNKYPGAEHLSQWYYLNPETFIDPKKVLDLNVEKSKGMSEQVVLKERDKVNYYVSAKDEEGNLTSKYRILVEYNQSNDKKIYNESFVNITHISDMLDKSGVFIYKKDGCTVLFCKEKTGYTGLSLVYDNLSIGIFWREIGKGSKTLTQEQIATNCGETVSKLFSKNESDVNKVLSVISEKVEGKQKQ